MSERVTMPALGESVTEGTVIRWLKNVGDTVEMDEPLLEVSTDKVDTEIPSPIAGTLQEILVQEDDTVPVGADLAVIGDGAPEQAEPAAPAEQAAPAAEEKPEEKPEEKAEEKPADQPAPAAPSTEQEPQPANSEPEAADSGGGTTGGETVTMPALGESVTEGTVIRWLKAEGDDVAEDEPLLEVSTDKVDTEIPSPIAGTLTKILAQEDDVVPVGGDLAVIGGSAAAPAPAPEAAAEPAAAPEPEAAPEPAAAPEPEAAPEPAAEAPSAPSAPAAAQSAPAATAPAQPEPAAPAEAAGESAAAYVTPLVRKLATQHGIDLAALTGTGVGGRIPRPLAPRPARRRRRAAPPHPSVAPGRR